MDQGKILVVDDSEVVLEATRHTLEEDNFSVATVSNVFQLNQEITSNPPDLILLDVRMPALPGDKVVGILKRYKFSRHIPVLLHSDMTVAELAELTERTGASGFIAKSENGNSLSEQIKAWIGVVRSAGSGGTLGPPAQQ